MDLVNVRMKMAVAMDAAPKPSISAKSLHTTTSSRSSAKMENVSAQTASIKDSQTFVGENRYVSCLIFNPPPPFDIHSYHIINISDNEALGNFIDSLELNSIGAESTSTSIGTQTHSRDANVQTESLESLDTPSELNDKFGAFSNRRVRNYVNYNRLDNSDCTKAESSLESSVKDESTQCELRGSFFSSAAAFMRIVLLFFSWRIGRV
jgi:hypothetical protein